MIETGVKTICKECGNEFRFFPHSTITPKRCKLCQNKADLLTKKVSASRIVENKKKLAQIEGKGAKVGKIYMNPPIKTKSNLRSSADAYFSKYMRLKHSFESNGERFCICYTCGACVKIKDAENGHWQRRGYYNTRYHEDNNRPQCHKCNYYHQGAPEKFELHLIKDLGQARVDNLKILSQSEGRDDRNVYQAKSDEYRNKLKDLIKEMETKNPWKR